MATDSELVVRYVDYLVTGDEGKLAEHWAVRDDLGVLRQLDGGEAPGERPRRPV